MSLKQGPIKLTVIDQALENNRIRTVEGMAHFAGTGPQGKTCRQCEHWTGCGNGSDYYSPNSKYHGMIKPRCCEQFLKLTSQIGPAVPHNMAACRHFLENKSPPEIVQRRSY